MAHNILKLILRLIGTSSLFALIFVFAPYSWMNSIHASLGMGTLPREPVVGYLARSLSAFYALVGGLLWFLSFDLNRYRSVLTYIGLSFSVFGVFVLIIDWMEGMPLFWKVWEGPFLVMLGQAIFILSRKIHKK